MTCEHGSIFCPDCDDATDEDDQRAVLSWDEVVEHCSRLHTTRTRKAYDGQGDREGSQMLDVLINGERAQIVPTRMHEPGFYWRFVPHDPLIARRRPEDIDYLHALVDAGRVTHAE